MTRLVCAHHEQSRLSDRTGSTEGGWDRSDAARIWRHERLNVLHTLIGLLELAKHGWAPPAPPPSSPDVPCTAAAQVIAVIDVPMVRALLVGKIVTAMDHGVRLRLSDGSSLRDCPAPPRELVTVLGNLIDNAIDAVLEHSHAEPWVEVELRKDCAAIELRVTDNGPGVPPQRRQWIFASGSSTKRHTDGRHSGLGLALVRRTVERRGGTVSVTAREGGGAVFAVRLPVESNGCERRAS